MGIFKMTADFTDAMNRGIVDLQDITGRYSWKGMDITLRNRMLFRGIDIHIPAGTMFREKSGQFQKMMMINPVNIYIPARRCSSYPLEDAICTQPSVPAPPPRAIQIDEATRSVATMSDQEFERRIYTLIQRGGMSKTTADKLRSDRQQILGNEAMMTAIRRGQSELRFDYTYSAIAPSLISGEEMADAYMGVAVNLYRYTDKIQAGQMLRKAGKNIGIGEMITESTIAHFESEFACQEAFHKKFEALTNHERGSWGERAALKEAEALGHVILVEHVNIPTEAGFDCVSRDPKTNELHIWEVKNWSSRPTISNDLTAWQDTRDGYPRKGYRRNWENILEPLESSVRNLIIQAINEGKVTFHLRLGPETRISQTLQQILEEANIPGAKYDWKRYTHRYMMSLISDRQERQPRS